MDTPNLSNVPSIKFKPQHSRTPSRSPNRSPTRQRITEDILSDLSPSTTLEAFYSTNPSGKLRASVEAATPSERAFGIRATLASKKIQEWVEELTAWPWPNGSGSEGFEAPPPAKRRKVTHQDTRQSRVGHPDNAAEEVVYMGSLPEQDILAYEIRLDEIHEDMEDLDVEGIKSNILITHTVPKSRPSSRGSSVGEINFPSTLSAYAKMDDFTAIVTATVLQSLPYLSRLNKLMDLWTIRFIVLRKVPPLLEKLQDTEIALRSGWQAIQVQHNIETGEPVFLDRKAFNIMRNVLQDKVKALGQELDYMLDSLEGREDTLPGSWIDRMETIEVNYGEWAVSADRKVWEGEWATMAKTEEEERNRLQASRAARIAAQVERERVVKDAEDGLRAKEEIRAAAVRLEEAREAMLLEEARMRREIEDRDRAAEQAREAARLEQIRLWKNDEDKIRAEEKAREAARLEAVRLQKNEEDRQRAVEEASEAFRLEELRLRANEEDRVRAVGEAKEAARLEGVRNKREEEDRLRLEQNVRELTRLEESRIRKEEEAKLLAKQVANDVLRLEAQKDQKQEERELRFEMDEVRRLKEHEHQRSILNAEDALIKAERAYEARSSALQLQHDELDKAARIEYERAQSLESKSPPTQKKAETAETTESRILEPQNVLAIESPAEDVCLDADHNVDKKKSRASRLLGHAATGFSGLKSVVRRNRRGTDGAESLGSESESESASSSESEPSNIDGQSDSKVAGKIFDKNEAKIARNGRKPRGRHPTTPVPKVFPLDPISGNAVIVSTAPTPKDHESGIRTPAPTPIDSAESIPENENEATPSPPKSEPSTFDGQSDSKIAAAAARRFEENASKIARNERRNSLDLRLTSSPTETNPITDVGIVSSLTVPMEDESTIVASSPSAQVVPENSNHESEDATTPLSPRSQPFTFEGHSDSKISTSDFDLPRRLDQDTTKGPDKKRSHSRRVTPEADSVSSLSTIVASSPAAQFGPEKSIPIRTLPNPFDEPEIGPEHPTTSDVVLSQNIEDASSPPTGSSTQVSDPTSGDSMIYPEIPPIDILGQPETEIAALPTEPQSAQTVDGAEDHIVESRIVLPGDEETTFPSSNGDEDDTLQSQPLIIDSLEIDSQTQWQDCPRGHVRNLSTGTASDPSPEPHSAEPAESFRPVSSPIQSVQSVEILPEPTTPTLPSNEPDFTSDELLAIVQHPDLNEPQDFEDPSVGVLAQTDGVKDHRVKKHRLGEVGIDYIDPSAFDGHASNPSASTISRPSSSASNTSTIINRQNPTFSPDLASSPVSTFGALEPFPDVDESPSAGRIGHRVTLSYDQSPPGSPTMPAISKLHLLNSPNLIPSSPLETPATPTSDPPNFPSLDLSPTPVTSPKKASTTDDQIQAQISNLLESIPQAGARFRLTSEPDIEGNPMSHSDTLHPRKVRRSLTPSVRSSSSMSHRAPTPSFTLAPAYSKSTPRPRHHASNPEIKLYHLSRSTGEAPIKLFVRLVGENGERVMVRVGGGWADLGEYLREYASHHGRRVVSGKTEDDKVEIQDLPSRAVSGTKASSSNGRASPLPPRPNSVLERERERPMSSLYIRKTRKSVGEQSDSHTSTINISPSTPSSPPHSSNDTSTPRSEGRSVSRLSWTEEESSLGLAGPKSKPKVISERDQEWVESMKEKVRLASAEKEKRESREGKSRESLGGGRKSFGEMEKVGGTKRLFKKSG